MSPNNPYLPGDEPENNHENASSQETPPPHQQQPDPHAGNPYANQQRQAAQPDLDANAPTLKSADIKSMNRRAMVFLGGIIALLVAVAFWIMSSASAPKPEAVKPPETVRVAEPPPVLPQAPQAPKLPPSIPLANNNVPPLPTPVAPTKYNPNTNQRSGPSLMERRMLGEQAAAQLGDNGAGGYGQPGQGQRPMYPMFPGQQEVNTRPPGISGQMHAPLNSPAALPDVSSAQPLNQPDTLLLRGTYIRCVLETHIITDIPGFASCIVTEPVYSFTGKRLLLPKGTKVLGKYDMPPVGDRAAVIWDRMVTPTGLDINMASPGVDNLGGAGHPGYLNSHWPSRIGSALLISLLSDAFSYEAAEHGPRNTTVSNGVVTQSPFQSNTAQTLQTLSQQAVQQAANRPATVTINQGTVLTIYVAKDVDFSGVLGHF